METPSRLGPPQAQTPSRSLAPGDAAGGGSTATPPAAALQLRPRPSWTVAIEDVSQTIRNSISSWVSAHLPLADPPPDRSKEDGYSLRYFLCLFGDADLDADLESGRRRGDDGGHDVMMDPERLVAPPEFAPMPRPLTLMTLPIEIQLNIIRHMPFADIEMLRRTGLHYRRLASQPILRATVGPGARKD